MKVSFKQLAGMGLCSANNFLHKSRERKNLFLGRKSGDGSEITMPEKGERIGETRTI